MMMGSLFTVRRARMVNDAGATNITSLVYQNGRDFGLNSQLRTIGNNWRFWILDFGNSNVGGGIWEGKPGTSND